MADTPTQSADAGGATLLAPAAVLPHRPPFLFLDQVTEMEQGQSARGYWMLTGDEWFFSGHFPGRPTLPGVLMCESIAQLGAYCVLQAPSMEGKLALFGGMEKARFRRQVVPGDRLDLEIEVVRLSAMAGKARGRALVGGKRACELELMLVVVNA